MQQTLNVRKILGYAAAAAIVNSIIYLIAKGADATMVVNQGAFKNIALPMVFASTLIGLVISGFIASRIAIKIQSFLSKAPVIGLLFGVVTAAAPFSASDDSKTSIALASMHIVAGVLWYFGVKRSAK